MNFIELKGTKNTAYVDLYDISWFFYDKELGILCIEFSSKAESLDIESSPDIVDKLIAGIESRDRGLRDAAIIRT